jgi:hypothetical protein
MSGSVQAARNDMRGERRGGARGARAAAAVRGVRRAAQQQEPVKTNERKMKRQNVNGDAKRNESARCTRQTRSATCGSVRVCTAKAAAAVQANPR